MSAKTRYAFLISMPLAFTTLCYSVFAETGDEKPERNDAIAAESTDTDFEFAHEEPVATGLQNPIRVAVSDDDDKVFHLSDDWTSDPDEVIRDVSLMQIQPAPLAPQIFESSPDSPSAANELTVRLFGNPTVGRSLLTAKRRTLARQPGTNVVFGDESRLRATTDAGSLLGKSSATIGVATEQRTPIITDPRIRGSNVGQLLASGSYWFPVRQDLDTLLSKIDSRIVDELIVIKGPYAARYGPGFNFVDVEIMTSPRYYHGYETHNSLSMEYKSNGQQWYGRETFWGGDDYYGFRIGYGHRTGSDYRSGNGTRLPSSYKAGDVDLALGVDLTDNSSLEFSYLRLDQSDVEIPGQVFDIDFLVTDAFEATYTHGPTAAFDQMTIEGWYNQTRMGGNAQGAGKRRQMPILDQIGYIGTLDANNNSSGAKFELNWGQEGDVQRTLGADLRYLRQELNEYDFATDPDYISPANTVINFPIPRARSANPGVFAEFEAPLDRCLTVRGGGRLDWVHTNARITVPGSLQDMFGGTLEDASLGKFNQNFQLGSAFLTAEYQVNDIWTASGGIGFAMRPPTMTELYAQSPFLAVLPQFAFTSPFGNPNLKAEKRTQIDIGANADYGSVRLGANAFHAWVQDYIALDYLTPLAPPADPGFVFRWTNSPRAILTGFELYGEHDVSDMMTTFGTMSYVEGRDRTRDANGFYNPNAIPGFPAFLTQPRSSTFGGTTLAASNKEPLPAIPPLEARLGIRLTDPTPEQLWGVELAVRIVDNQDRIALSLYELPTPGFTTVDLRSFGKMTDNLVVFAGVENLTDNNYQEHLDSRIFSNVYQPGVNFYFGMELVH